MTVSLSLKELLQQFELFGYTVTPEGDGYRVASHSDQNDVSHARHLSDLVDLASLLAWAAQFRREQQLPSS